MPPIKTAQVQFRESSLSSLCFCPCTHLLGTADLLLHVFGQASALFALGFIRQRKSHFLKKIRVLAQDSAHDLLRRRKLSIRINEVIAEVLHAKMIGGTAHSSEQSTKSLSCEQTTNKGRNSGLLQEPPIYTPEQK